MVAQTGHKHFTLKCDLTLTNQTLTCNLASTESIPVCMWPSYSWAVLLSNQQHVSGGVKKTTKFANYIRQRSKQCILQPIICSLLPK